jgi:hypothetical protein
LRGFRHCLDLGPQVLIAPNTIQTSFTKALTSLKRPGGAKPRAVLRRARARLSVGARALRRRDVELARAEAAAAVGNGGHMGQAATKYIDRHRSFQWWRHTRARRSEWRRRVLAQTLCERSPVQRRGPLVFCRRALRSSAHVVLLRRVLRPEQLLAVRQRDLVRCGLEAAVAGARARDRDGGAGR